jgi:hypothetical protein
MPCEQKKKYAEIPGLPFRVLVQHTQYLQRQERESTRTQYSERKERESTHTRTHTIYFTERARTHAHTMYFTDSAHTMYFTGEETMHKTFLCAHTHRSHQSQIQHAKCVRLTFSNHCCVSSAAAQKQSTCKSQGMDLLLAQRSMIRA